MEDVTIPKTEYDALRNVAEAAQESVEFITYPNAAKYRSRLQSALAKLDALGKIPQIGAE